MKNILAALLIILGIYCNAQTVEPKDVPSAIKSKFETLYPDIKDAKWGKVVFNYEAEFMLNGGLTAVLFDVKGIVLETNSEIKATELPKLCTDYLNKNYPWKKIRNTIKIVDVNGRITFRVGVGVKEMVFIFDYQGNFLRQLKM